MERQTLLEELGRRLREARRRAGLSLAELAREAGASRRYVTDAEAGRANLSITKLADLAAALGVPLRELCDLAVSGRRRERIALVGLRGAGKSSVGARLALALEVPFVELDRYVEQLAGMTLAEVFSLHGEAHFHRLEAEALEAVLAQGDRAVIAAGGSIVAAPASFARLRETCRTVWLRATPREHFERVLAQGDRRPMANRPRAMAELEALLAARSGEYARCEIAVDTSGKGVDEVVAEVERALARA